MTIIPCKRRHIILLQSKLSTGKCQAKDTAMSFLTLLQYKGLVPCLYYRSTARQIHQLSRHKEHNLVSIKAKNFLSSDTLKAEHLLKSPTWFCTYIYPVSKQRPDSIGQMISRKNAHFKHFAYRKSSRSYLIIQIICKTTLVFSNIDLVLF